MIKNEGAALALRISDIGDEIRGFRRSRTRAQGAIVIGSLISAGSAFTLSHPALLVILAAGWLTLVVGVGALYRECGRHINKREEVLESLLAPPAT